MNAFVIFRQIKAIVLVAVFILVSWGLFVFSPDLSHLLLELKADTKQAQRIDAFFYQQGKEPEGLAYRQAKDLSVSQPYYLVMPNHFDADGVIIDLGKQATSSWTLERAALRSRFLLFSLDTHYWPSQILAKTLQTRQATTSIVSLDGVVQIESQTQRPRLFLSLDVNAAMPTLEFNLLRLGLVFLFAYLLLVMWRGHLWRFIQALVISRHNDWQILQSSFSAQKSKRWSLLGAGLLLLVLLYQLYPYWLAPGFYIEDTMEFSDAASSRSSLWSLDSYRYYRGYFVFVSELIVGLANIFPVTWQAHLYMGVSSFFLFSAIYMLCSSGIFNSRLMLLVAPVFILLVAFTDKIFYLSITGTLFSTTLMVIALALRPIPSALVVKLLWLLVIVALAWSGPYSAQLLPFALLMLLFFGTGQRVFLYVFMAALACLYVASSAAGLTQFSNLLEPEIPVAFYRALVGHILYFNLFGTLDYKYGVLVILFTACLLYLWRSDGVFQKISLVFLAIGLSSFLTYYISSKYQQYAGQLLSYHVVMSQFCWLVFLLLCADRFLQRISTSMAKPVASIVVVMIFTGLFFSKQKVLLKTTYFPPDEMLSEFLSAVDFAKSIKLEQGEFIQLWYVKRRQLFTTSFHRGSNEQDAKQVKVERLPDFVKKFLAPVHLRREINSMVDYDTLEGVLIYATFEDPSFKRRLDRPSHLTE